MAKEALAERPSNLIAADERKVQRAEWTGERFSIKEISADSETGKVYAFIKRSFDIVTALLLGLLLIIPMLCLAFFIRLDSPGPALFRQKRMGKDGKTFTIYKFRSMCVNAPHNKATNEFDNLSEYTTRLGRFMRKTSIDELPQILNVLKGDMSFVGYRPVCLTEVDLNQMRMDYGVFQVRPGITGLAQVLGRDDVTKEEKAYLDAYYVQHRCIRMDFWCIYRTFAVVLTQEGAR